MKKQLVGLISLFVLISGCTNNATQEPNERREEEPVEDVTEETDRIDEETPDDRGAELTVIAENLEIPWSIEKEGDIFYVTERAGTIAKVEAGEVVRQVVQLERELSTEAEAGLMGFVLDPDFSSNQQALAYYTYSGNEGPTNRIVRLQLKENKWTEVDILLDDVPSGAVHHGGRLAIGPDEKLYATTGDATIPELSQDIDSLAGKILRLNFDGSIPEDNPFEDSYVYSYGHRNAQGLTWLEDGTMYASEHGNQANDEINEIEVGKNYGWPLIEGMEASGDMVPPLFTSGSGDTWAPSGMDQHGENLYVAALRGSAVLEFQLNSGEMVPVLSNYGRIRDIYIEEDFLYFVTNNTDGRGRLEETDDRLLRMSLSK